MLRRHSISQSIHPDSASAARVSAAPVEALVGEAWTARAGDVVRLKSGGVVMTAERVSPEAEHPVARCVWLDARQALHREFIGLDALERVSAEDLTGADCPETRMAGDITTTTTN